MPGFFDALKKFKPHKKTDVMVEKNGKQLLISREKYKEILSKGIENFELVKGELVFQQIKTHKHNTLLPAQQGTAFFDGNVFWPNGLKEKGHVWKKN